MELFYNRQRRQSTIKYEAPLAFEALTNPELGCPPFVGKISSIQTSRSICSEAVIG
jgi:hypothetical protein